MQSAPKRDAVKYSSFNFRMRNADFVLADQPRTRSLSFSKFLRNGGNIPKRCPCFVDFEKAYDRVPRDRLWVVLLNYDVRGQLLAAIKSLYKQSEGFVRVKGMKTKPFSVSVGLRQKCALPPLLFIKYMDKIDRNGSSSSGVTFGD